MSGSEYYITPSERQRTFAYLLSLEDKGWEPAKARRCVATRFDLTLQQVASIVQEGCRKGWLAEADAANHRNTP